MKEISLREGITVSELLENFLKQTQEMIPGKWKFVGIQFYLVDEEEDILSAPGIYSKGFDKANYEGDQ